MALNTKTSNNEFNHPIFTFTNPTLYYNDMHAKVNLANEVQKNTNDVVLHKFAFKNKSLN